MTVEQGNVVNAEAAFTQHQLQQQIEAAQQGDMVAYRQLYDRFVGKVYALSYRLTGDAAMAEDATQEVFVQVWQKLGNFSGKSQFATWLHSVTANITISYLRKQKGWLKRMFSMEPETEQQLMAEPATDLTQLDKCIVRLPERARLVIARLGFNLLKVVNAVTEVLTKLLLLAFHFGAILHGCCPEKAPIAVVEILTVSASPP